MSEPCLQNLVRMNCPIKQFIRTAKKIRNLVMVKHRGESSKMGQAGPLLQAAAGGLQVQTRSQTAGAAYEERGSEQ
ncbi:hypothetical protein BHE74_00048062, partial [Ensete ventricosum]